MAETDEQDERKRSPNYPSISLQAAVAKIVAIYPTIKLASGTKETLADLWKTTAKSSSFLQTLGSLRKYGLLQTISGTPKKFKLTRDALDIVLLPESDARHSAALKRASLAPKLFKSLWDEHGADVVSDTDLRHLLVTAHQFLPDAADDAIKQYRKNISFAKLVKDDKISEDDTGAQQEGQTLTTDAGKHRSIEVGDYVQWESQGAMQFPEPRQVVAKQTHKDGEYLMVANSKVGIPVAQAQRVDPPDAKAVTPMAATPATPAAKPNPAKTDSRLIVAGMLQEVTTVAGSQASLHWPRIIDEDDYEDLRYWLNGVLRKVKREVVRNRTMIERIRNGEAINVRDAGTEVEPGLFKLEKLDGGLDYCDLQAEVWILSIGENRKTHEIFAATDGRFYQNPDYECLWLR